MKDMIDQTTDPDYYYHVAISRHILEHGLPHSLPQVKGTGWDILFSDKEFLFHQLTTLFYWIFGELGLRLVPLVVSFGTFSIMALRAFQRLPKKYALLPLVILFSEPYFLRRITMVRPHVLAIFFFTLLIYSLLTRKKYLVALSAALYTLSYHALQIPLMVLFAGVFTLSSADKERKKCLIALAIGLTIGIFINPYFPGNLMIIPQIIDIVLDTHKGSLPYGAELYPWISSSLLNYSLVTFLLCGFVLYNLGIPQKENARDNNPSDQKMLLVLASFFFAVSSMTPRGREYLIPCLFFIATFAIENRSAFHLTFKKLSLPFVTALLLTVLVQFALVKSDYSFLKQQETPNPILTALEKTPPDGTGHVLNCNWSDSPYIMYSRPKMTFLDIMDPSFLLREAPGLHLARTDLLNGHFADLYFSAKYVFKAKYVFCSENNLNDRLDHDPRFVRIYPDAPVKNKKDVYALFALNEKQQRSFFISSFLYQIAQAKPTLPSRWQSLSPSLPVSNNPLDQQKIEYFDFNKEFGAKQLVTKSEETTLDGKKMENGTINCVYVKPSPEDLGKHLGAEYLGIGGGPNFRVWINEKPLFESYGEPSSALMIQTLVPLPHPLKAQDDIKALICPGTSTQFFGVAMSFFTFDEIDSICKEKKSLDLLTRREKLEWPFKGESVKTCLANMAARR